MGNYSPSRLKYIMLLYIILVLEQISTKTLLPLLQLTIMQFGLHTIELQLQQKDILIIQKYAMLVLAVEVTPGIHIKFIILL